MADSEQPTWKLQPELVPRPLWFISANRVLSRAQWRRIRAEVLAEANSTCSICRATQDKGMVCHEVWQYNDTAHTALLTNLVIICPDCNFVHHIGRASQIGQAARAIEHMMAVNGMTKAETTSLIDSAFAEWAARSRHVWTLSVDPELVARFPDLALLNKSLDRPEGLEDD